MGSFVLRSLWQSLPLLLSLAGTINGEDYPTRVIAGVTVIDTPIVRDAQAFARAHSTDFVYKHVIRGWLFGALLIQANETLRRSIDLEVHAVANILHDLGWDQTPGSPFISTDRRFEVDGAIAARHFIREHRDGKKWTERRVQLVWDAIALHGDPSFADYKEPDVQIVSKGIREEFHESNGVINKQQFNAIVREFPNDDFNTGGNQTAIWLCQTKPSTTWGTVNPHPPSNYPLAARPRALLIGSPPTETFLQGWGDRYVANYSANVLHRIDRVYIKPGLIE